jgi:glycosyltransferase involved in cell wall biosynthesis
VKIDAIEADNCIRTLGIIRPYLLCVSHVYPYKNLVELITAFELIESDTMQLVLVGEAVLQERYFTEVKKAAERASRYPQQVLLTGALSREQVGILLQECMAFVFPSTCENCPIGLVEALAYKLPIACSNVGVMPEIAGKAALLFDPYQPSDIAQTVKMLIMEPDVRADLARKAQDELARFGTPNEVADATWGLLTRVVDSVR